jgi:hypothetical protein
VAKNTTATAAMPAEASLRLFNVLSGPAVISYPRHRFSRSLRSSDFLDQRPSAKQALGQEDQHQHKEPI